VRGVVSIVHIDICDGVTVINLTWPFLSRVDSDNIMETDLDEHFHRILNEQEGMPFWEDIDFELDLMVADAVDNFDIYSKLSPKRIIFHLEAVGNLDEFKNFLEGMDVYVRDAIQIGIAINTTTPIEQVFPLVDHADFVQCMGIEKIGFQGQEFDARVLGQIKSLKEKFPNIIISVDGGVNFETAPKLIEAGADRLVAGSLILKSQDIRETISELENL
jgi:ribulose-phosphate 3-epimerase